MVSYIPLVAAKKAAIGSTPMHGAFSTDAHSNGCGTNAVANSFVPFLRTTAIQSCPGARSKALALIHYLELSSVAELLRRYTRLFWSSRPQAAGFPPADAPPKRPCGHNQQGLDVY